MNELTNPKMTLARKYIKKGYKKNSKASRPSNVFMGFVQRLRTSHHHLNNPIPELITFQSNIYQAFSQLVR